MKNSKYAISGDNLKYIAMATMLIDHIGFSLFPQNMILRIIGRFAFPIYAFLLVEGFIYTSNRLKYALRLLLFAFISEPFFDLMLSNRIVYLGAQNVFFTLFLGFITIWVMSALMDEMDKTSRLGKIIYVFLMLGVLFLSIYISDVLSVDYSTIGIIFISVFYLLRDDRYRRTLILIGFIISMGTGMMTNVLGTDMPVQYFEIFPVFLVLFYSSDIKPKTQKFKYLFYIFYPVHIFILVIIRSFLK